MRNKLYIVKYIKNFSDYPYPVAVSIDLGEILSTEYYKNKTNFISESNFDSYSYFRTVISSQIKETTTKIVFSNLGILMESDFALDVPKFLLNYAKEYQVFIVWPYTIIDNKKLIWQTDFSNNVIEFDSNVLENAGEKNEIF